MTLVETEAMTVLLFLNKTTHLLNTRYLLRKVLLGLRMKSKIKIGNPAMKFWFLKS